MGDPQVTMGFEYVTKLSEFWMTWGTPMTWERGKRLHITRANTCPYVPWFPCCQVQVQDLRKEAPFSHAGREVCLFKDNG